MAPAFSKEAILQGNIDHLCLVCESHLKTDHEVCHHISTYAHRRNLARTDYVEKYRNDRIRKVKKWYYCEFCNVLVYTITRVRLHVEEIRHKESMSSEKIARLDKVIDCGNLVISDEAWNGIIEEYTCIICNVEFENKGEHMCETIHVINLIESKVNNDFNNIYRKIDDTTFQCLTCNTVVAEITAHLDENEHKNIILKCTKILPGEDGKEKNPKMEICTPQAVNEINVIDDKTNLLNKSFIDINILCTKTPVQVTADIQTDKNTTETKTDSFIICGLDGKTSCILCNCNVDPLEIKLHFDSSHHQDMLKKDSSEKCNTNDDADDNDNTSKILDSIQKFQHENININLKSRTARCRKCSAALEFDFQAIDTHVEQHNNNVEKKKNQSTEILFENDEIKVTVKEDLSDSTSSQPVEKINEENLKTENIQRTHEEVIQEMADEYNLARNGKKLYCLICNKRIPVSLKNINEHVKGHVHRYNVERFKRQIKDEMEKKRINDIKLQKEPIKKFVTKLSTCKTSYAEDVVLNKKYFINILSLIFIDVPSPGRFRCHACKESFHFQFLKNHIELAKHNKAVNDAVVIVRQDLEFIRELHPGVFHCGYCNVIGSWLEIEKHLESTEHEQHKGFAGWRLSRHLLEIGQRAVQKSTDDH